MEIPSTSSDFPSGSVVYDKATSSDFPSGSVVHDKAALCVRLLCRSAESVIKLCWKDGKIRCYAKKFLPRSLLPELFFWASAYLDGTLYLLGGGNNGRISDVHQIPKADYNFPRMLTRRSKPQTAVVSGKLFVMGEVSGFHFRDGGHWGEVYDPSHRRWDPLRAPEDLKLLKTYTHFTMIALLEAEEKILLSLSNSRVIYAYDVRNQSWDPYHTLVDPLQFAGRGFVVDGVIYCSLHASLYAYDMSDRSLLFITFAKILWGAQIDLPSDDNPLLQHMGGNSFCLVWNVVDGVLSFVHFQVSIAVNVNQHRYLRTSINYMDSHSLDIGAAAKLLDFLTLDDFVVDFVHHGDDLEDFNF